MVMHWTIDDYNRRRLIANGKIITSDNLSYDGKTNVTHFHCVAFDWLADPVTPSVVSNK